MSIRRSAIAERLRGSLFFVPMLFVVAGGGLGLAALELDASADARSRQLPFVLTSTVDSAREVLGVVATATITVAGIAFSVVLLVIQQASGQFSPRVVHSLFRDPFNRRVVGVAVGTFTYCLIVLRAVRGPLEEGGEAAIPNLSVALAVVFGIAAMLAIIAFIDHNAHNMEVSKILRRVTDDAVAQIERTWTDEAAGQGHEDAAAPSGTGHSITAARSGWLQQVSRPRMLALVPDGGTVRLETTPGRFVVRGAPLCTVWPAPDDAAEAHQGAQRAIEIGSGRTLQQDPSYGIRQLADVALIALSPGVNDPTTAQDAIFHLAAVLREALVRDLPARVDCDDHGRRLLRPEDHTHDSLIELAFGEIRRTGAAQPRVAIYVLEALHLLHQAVIEAGRPERTELLRRQAELVLAESQRSDALPVDSRDVEDAFRHRFGTQAPTTAGS